MRKNDRDAKFDRENVFKVRPGKSCKIRPGKLYKVWPKSLAENCCKRKQTQSISAMNSQSSIHRLGKLLQNSAEKSLDKKLLQKKANAINICYEFSEQYQLVNNLTGIVLKTLQNSNLLVLKNEKLQPNWDASAIDRDHVYTLVDRKLQPFWGRLISRFGPRGCFGLVFTVCNL